MSALLRDILYVYSCFQGIKIEIEVMDCRRKNLLRKYPSTLWLYAYRVDITSGLSTLWILSAAD
jgi:hypothetical protein